MKTPYIINCQLIKRETDDILFHAEDEVIYPYLDGYTIIPTEQYEELKNEKSKSSS